MSPSELIGSLQEYTTDGFKIDIATLKEVGIIIYEVGSYLLGLSVILIYIIMFLVTIVDLFYIHTPLFRDSYESWYTNKYKDGKARFLRLAIVSKDAMDSVKEGMTSNRTPIRLYLSKRIKTIVLASFYIVVAIGGISIITRVAATVMTYLFSGLS